MLKPILVRDLRECQEFLVIEPPACYLYKVLKIGLTLIHAVDMISPAGCAHFNMEQQVWIPADGKPLGKLIFGEDAE